MGRHQVRRIFINIQRGLTDAHTVCVWPWEKPIIEEVHGDQARVVTIDTMCSKDGIKSVKEIKFTEGRRSKDDENVMAEKGLSMREQMEAMTLCDDEDHPANDPLAEYGRMVAKYGMHKDFPIPVAEKVFGSDRMLRQCIREWDQGRTPALFLDDDAEVEQKAIADMTVAELREKATAAGGKFNAKSTREDLEAFLIGLEERAAA